MGLAEAEALGSRPSQDRGTTQPPLQSSPSAANCRRYTATAAAIQFKFPCQQWPFPKPLLSTFLLWTWRPISKQLQSVFVYVSAIATPM